MTIDTYGEMRAIDPGPRFYDANGDHWIRAGWDHNAVLTPVHRLRADTIDLYMPPPGRSLPHGPFTPHDNTPDRLPDPTHHRIQACADYERADRARVRAQQAAAQLAPRQVPTVPEAISGAVERAFRAREETQLCEEAWHAFRTLANLSDSHAARDKFLTLARDAASRAAKGASDAAAAADNAEHAADQATPPTRTERP